MAFDYKKGGLESVADGVHVYIGPGGSSNNGIILTDEGTVSIDSFITNYDGLMQSIEQVTNRAVGTAINTHDDADHYTMNHVFRRQGATIFASDVCRERIKTKMGMGVWIDNLKSRNPAVAHELDKPEEMIPHVGIEDAVTLMLAGEQIDLIHVGHGHCPGDLIVNLPERGGGVLFAGDRPGWNAL
ncbi:MAG: MBL fold metallo-hydrolase, partial [Rhodospirillales bacterium]